MKKSPTFVKSFLAQSGVRTPAVMVIAAILAVVFWFSTVPSGLADPAPPCTVCHKRNQTLMLVCGSLEYRRHLDHGDPMGPCGSSTP